MPTYYTSKLTPDSDLRAYALDVARGFGALMHMRDEPNDAPITLPEASPYHENKLLEANLWLGALESMSDAKKKIEAKNAYLAAQGYYQKSYERAIVERESYRNMLAKVKAWQPPTTEHQGLKDDMIRQLVESDQYSMLDDADRVPKLQRPEEWHAAALAQAKKDVEWHTKQWADEKERTAKRRQWVIDLQNSLPPFLPPL